jgi:putative OmpL-like beta-barrel porin-2
MKGTRSALTTAVALARGAGARLRVLVPQVVPYPLDAGHPVESTDFVVRRYRDLVDELGGEAAITVCVCRRPDDVSQLLPDGATVVVGGAAARWLPNEEQRLMRRMQRLGHHVIFVATAVLCLLAIAIDAAAQTPAKPQPQWQYGAFVDVADLFDTNTPANHLFRNRGTTPDVDEIDLNMVGAYVRKTITESSRAGFEATVQTGKDSEIFGFSATAPNIGGADALRHLGPTNASYLAPVGKGLTIQGGIFGSLIGYDSLYAKDNLNDTRPWGADYTPYLMLGVNASYPASDKLTITGAVLNGYWHLAHANDAPSVAAQIAYKANDQITVKQTVLYGSHQPETALANWRVFSDTWVERKTARITAAAEYQFGSEEVAAAGNARAQWMAGQLPVQWRVGGPWALTVRPEFAWDRDGRWIGAPQSIVALTSTVEYRAGARGAQAIVRGEYRVDNAHGSGGGFFAGDDNHLTPTQNLFILAVILTFDGTHPWSHP